MGFMAGTTFGCGGVSRCCGAIGVCGFSERFSYAGCVPFLRTCSGTVKYGRCCRGILEVVSFLGDRSLGTIPVKRKG